MRTLLVACWLLAAAAVARAEDEPTSKPVIEDASAGEAEPAAKPVVDAELRAVAAASADVKPPSAAPIVEPEPTTDDEVERPPLDGGRVIGEFLLGAVGAVGGAAVAGKIGYHAALDERCFEDCGDNALRRGAVPAGAVGLTIGASLGIYLVGAYGDEGGSYLATVGGIAVGGVLGLVPALAGQEIDLVDIVFMGLAPVVGGTLAFNVTRRYDLKAPPLTPVANVAQGTAALGVAGRF